MDIGSLGGETFMVAGNRVAVELALERSPHFYILPATLFSLGSEGSRDDTEQARSVTNLPSTHTVEICPKRGSLVTITRGRTFGCARAHR